MIIWFDFIIWIFWLTTFLISFRSYYLKKTRNSALTSVFASYDTAAHHWRTYERTPALRSICSCARTSKLETWAVYVSLFVSYFTVIRNGNFYGKNDPINGFRVVFLSSELCPSKDAGDDVVEFLGRAEPQLQRGVSAQVSQDDPRLLQLWRWTEGHYLPGSGASLNVSLLSVSMWNS